jgi:hypothetical protein
MTKEEIAQEMLRRCEDGAQQQEAAKAMAEELGLSWRSVFSNYTECIPTEQRPSQSKQGKARRERERQIRAAREAQPVITRCAGCRRVVHEGPMGEGRVALAAHRETCSTGLPPIVGHEPGTLDRSPVSRVRGGYEARVPGAYEDAA